LLTFGSTCLLLVFIKNVIKSDKLVNTCTAGLEQKLYVGIKDYVRFLGDEREALKSIGIV
jgi:hypothetical protein